MTQSNNHINHTDEELLQLYRTTSDNRWMGIILQRYTLLLLGVAMKYLKDRAAAEDAVQQVFLKAITHLPKEEIQNLKGWLYILTRNYCLQQLRNKTYFASEEVLQQIKSEESSKEELLRKEYTLEQMNEAVKELNEEQRATIKLFYLEKKSYQQITDTTGFSFMQVKSFIQNGKRNLKTILLKKLGDSHE